jgi:AcrR family transcriptional regulator
MNKAERQRYEALFDAYADPPSQREMLIAAVECFAEKGFHATTTRDIAKLAEMSPAALYMHFKDKSEVLFRIMFIVASAVLDRMKAAAASHSNPADRLRALVYAQVYAHAELRTAARVVDREFYTLPLEHRRPILALRDESEKMYSNVLADGRKSGEFQFTDLRMTELAIYSMSVAVARWFRPEGPRSDAEIAEIFQDLAVSMVRKQTDVQTDSVTAPERTKAAGRGRQMTETELK